MAELRIYRTYRYINKNPVIDKTRTLLQDEGVYKNLKVVSEITGVAVSTLDGWFNGDTKNPFHQTIAAVVTGFGYEEQFVKKREINLDAEREAAAKWREARERLKKRKQKQNGKGGK
jgi:transcriptional regulator with XRE-family HTH domain